MIRGRRRFTRGAAGLALVGIVSACSRRDAARDVEGATATAQAGPVSLSTDPASCPATGLWSPCQVLKSLDRAGLAPRADSEPVHTAPLRVRGVRVHVGNAELDAFVYATVAARSADAGRLDRKEYIAADQEPTMRGEPTLIENANLLVVFRSRNGHQRERVSDAITAGPPQPAAPAAPARIGP